MPMPGHHVPMVVVGTFILAFGWFGFNPGSTLAGTDLRISAGRGQHDAGQRRRRDRRDADPVMPRSMKPDPTMMCNGMLAGLVAITAPCAFVDSWAAVLIGGIAGVLVVLSVFFWERRGIDDPVGAISVHGVNGLWGVISLGHVRQRQVRGGLERRGPRRVRRRSTAPTASADCSTATPRSLWPQLLDAAVVVVFGFVMAYVWFKFSNLITPIRVSRETEIEGLDGPEMGALGYPDFTVASRG